jgi:hypothetical protein
MKQETTKDTPILTLYLNYPMAADTPPAPEGESAPRLTDTLRLRYREGQYELISQHNVTPLLNGETIVLDNLSLTVHVEDLHVASIEAITKQTYQQLADTVPTLERLRELSPIDTDPLAQQKRSEEITTDPLAFLNIPLSPLRTQNNAHPFPSGHYQGYHENKFAELNQYFQAPNVAHPSVRGKQEIAHIQEEGNILKDLGFL